jgi:indolepyruvate decarboxylase
MTVGDFLLRRLPEAGISHLFCVAGDFNLEFLLQMEKGNEFMWVCNCTELKAADAADGPVTHQASGCLLPRAADGAGAS